MNQQTFSRRTFLRGVGVSMALPWMESLRVWGDEAKAVRGGSEAPVRLAVLFAGNGFHSKEWWARGAGRSMELGQVLAPLADFRDRMLFIRGLYNAEALKGNIHSSQTGNLLSGAPLASGGEIRSGMSFDQLFARTHGKSTKVPSLVLACEKSNPSVHKNYSMLYSSHISWTSPTAPSPLELYPALAFDRLFRDEAERGDKSVLDAVLADARDFRRVVSSADQRKLDEYLDSVREVEQRIRACRPARRAAGLAANSRSAQYSATRRWDSSRHWRAHAPDVRHPRARLPDRHHAHLLAQAQQRSQLAAISQSRCRLHDPSPAVALRHGRLAEGQSVLLEACRLHRASSTLSVKGTGRPWITR